MSRIIARIVEVKGISVKAELYELIPPYMTYNGRVFQAPKINSYVKTKVGLDIIICQIRGEYYNEYFRKENTTEHDALKTKNASKTGYYLDLSVLGYISDGKFIQGLRVLPIVSANIEMLDLKDYEIIYKTAEEKDINLGPNLFDLTNDVVCDINDLFVSHIGIFGNTGSGKSNTVVSLLQKYMSKVFRYNTCNEKTIVFDLNNEYGDNAIIQKEYKKIYNLKTKGVGDKIPFDFNNLNEDQMCIFLNATEKTQTPIIKQTFSLFKEIKNGKVDEEHFKDKVKNVLVNAKKELFMNIRFHLSNYISNLNHFSYHNKKEEFYYDAVNPPYYYGSEGFNDQLDNIEVDFPREDLDLFMFSLLFCIANESEKGSNYDFISPLINRYKKLKNNFEKIFEFGNNDLDFGDKKMIVIQLANVNNDMKEIVPNLLSSIEFQKQVDYKDQHGNNDKIVTFVIDEAHNLLYEDVNDKLHSEGLYMFEKIIKEGRKFATFLLIASQRPSDISNTIMSQLHNYFIHKLVNPNDLSKIRKTVAFLDEDALNFITVLGPGECVASGTAISIPSFIKIPQVDEDYRPKSANVVLIGNNGIFN